MPGIRSAYTDSCSFYGNYSPAELLHDWGSPLYVYNENILRLRCRELIHLTSHPSFYVNYSVKANSNPSLLHIIREEGLVVDAMSPGELHMDELSGFTRDEIIYISNNIDSDELRNAVTHTHLVSVDSLSQLETFGQCAPGNNVMIRFNPGIGAGHHSNVITGGMSTKFGITPDQLPDVFSILTRYDLRLVGVNQHIGSLFMEPDAYLAAVDVLLRLVESLPDKWKNHVRLIDFGGGFGIPYHKYDGEKRLDMISLGQGLHTRISSWTRQHVYAGRFLIEPGRYVVAECGILLGRALATKNNGYKRFVGTDLGFNVLARPVLYDAFHDVEIYGDTAIQREERVQNIVGNICESGDILAKDRLLPAICEGDILGILDTGAYGFTMSSNYNQRYRPAEVLINSDGTARCIRRRETLKDLDSCFPTA